MMRRIAMFWVVLALSGCMLPQPDTPIIPPQTTMGDLNREGPAEGTAPASEPVAPEPVASDALVSGTVAGEQAEAIVAVAEPGGQSVRQELGSDGAFDLTLAPGVYRLELRVGVQIVTLEERLTVEAGTVRQLTLRLTRDPLRVTIEEATPDTPASP